MLSTEVLVFEVLGSESVKQLLIVTSSHKIKFYQLRNWATSQSEKVNF